MNSIDSIRYLLSNQLEDINIPFRSSKDRITIIDNDEVGRFQLRIEKRKSDFYIHAVRVIGKRNPKTIMSNDKPNILYIPRKKRLFSINLNDRDGMYKIIDWLKEVRSKLK